MEQLLSTMVTSVVSFSDAETCLEQLQSLQPDLILIDLQMPGMDGLSFIQALSARQILVSVLVLSATEDPRKIKQALQAGAFGFISKSADKLELRDALNCVLRGDIYIVPEMEHMVALEGDNTEGDGAINDCGLAPRQIQVLQLLAKGYSNKKISLILFISDETVKSHVQKIFQRLNVSSRTEAVTRAIEYNLIDL